MSISELQNDIIKQLRTIEDIETLTLFKEMLSHKTENHFYNLTDFEKQLVAESMVGYNSGNILNNEVIFKRNKKWLDD